MNAIELADKLETHDSKDMIVFKASAMLRQQAREIEVLKQSYEILFKHRIEQEKLIASISKQSLVEDLNDMHIAKSIQKARNHFKFGEKK